MIEIVSYILIGYCIIAYSICLFFLGIAIHISYTDYKYDVRCLVSSKAYKYISKPKKHKYKIAISGECGTCRHSETFFLNVCYV